MQNEKDRSVCSQFQQTRFEIIFEIQGPTSAANFNDFNETYAYVTILHKKPLKFIDALNCAGL